MKIRDLLAPKGKTRFPTSFDALGSKRKIDVAKGMNDPARSATAKDSDLLAASERSSGGLEPFVCRLEAQGATPPDGKDAPIVREIMTTDVRSCRPDRTLVAAAAAMHWGDCRFLPVVDDAGRPIGVITDGDICLIGTSDQRPLRSILVSEAMSRAVATCHPEDSLHEVLETMKRRRIRHLPVVDRQGNLVGVVSLTDVILRIEEGEASVLAPLRRQVSEVLRAVSQKQQGTRAVRFNPFRED
jgi:CBS domain-containing protein